MATPEELAPTGLPVEEAVAEVRAALADIGTAVLVAPPGAGKTTVVPLRLLGERWLGDQRIVVLEPRRLAARAAAQRMAELLGERVGDTVGFRTRDERAVGPRTRIEVVTEGILVRRLQQDPSLEGTGLVILDEVHERNLVTDLSLALALDARRGLRPDLRILAMSATVAAERFAEVLTDDEEDAAPVVRSEGRTYPVQVAHRPPEPRDRPDAHLARTVAEALRAHPEGDVLVFLAGASDIRRVGDRLRQPGALPDHIDVLALFGALAQAEQDRALQPSAPGRRRVVLATDIAESSLTVAGVRVVVDAGLVRVPRFDPATGMTRLQTEPASQASADQRAGRAGRLGPGVAVRAWDEADRSRRPRFAAPEIATADLAGFALELATWGAGPDELALIDAPPTGAWERAQALLRSLHAIDAGGRPTARGRAMAALPLHPRLAAMVVDGAEAGRGWTAVLLAALLDERDVLRGRPGELPADLGSRLVALDGDRGVDGPGGPVDRRAASTVRRRAEQLARRAGVRRAEVVADDVGVLVAAAFPERIAQARGGGGFRLRGGGGGGLARTDPLAALAHLAVARIETGIDGPVITLAAPLTAGEVRALVADDLETITEVTWDEDRDDLRQRTEERAGALVLSTKEGPAERGEAATAALVERVRATEGRVLPWNRGVRSLQARVELLHRLDPQRWPDLSDAALLASLDEWLAPFLAGATSRRDLERIDLRAALRSRMGHHDLRAIDELVPLAFAAADGREVPISYDGGQARASVRVQRLFSLTVHPTVAQGSVPVVLELLSPADRPIQVTADLPGFWAGSWAEVRKEMAGRYPKHDWPVDPSTEPPPAPRRRRA